MSRWHGNVDRAADELEAVLTAALARLDDLERATPTQLLMAGQYCEPTLFDWGTA